MSGPDIEGLDRLLDVLRKSPDLVRKTIGKGLYTHALLMFAQSQLQVPVATGVLRGTGIVEPPRGNADPEVIIGYGGPAAPYAKVQHERTDFKHQGNEKAKYLEDPVRDGIPAMQRDIEQALINLARTL